MLAAQRRQIIAERLQAAGRVTVSELSGEFGVSEETIRRDLECLENEGLAKRAYGGAVLNGGDKAPPPYAIRKNTNVEGKLAIAQLAAALVEEGDSIMVDESSTAFYTVQALRAVKDLTVITNSLEILRLAGERSGWHIISTGGSLLRDVMAQVGRHALEAISSYYVKWAFLSCRGINTQLGYADSSDEVVQVKRAMARSAGQTVLLADHRKFDRPGFTALGPLELADRLITDREPPRDWIARFEERGVVLVRPRDAKSVQLNAIPKLTQENTIK